MRHVGVSMKWLMMVLLGLALGACTKLSPGVMESCQATSDCAQGLVCLGNRCGECRQDSECPGVAKCGLVQAGRCGCFDADGDGASCDDCDDADPARFPSAAEVCDGKDNDCDGTVDEGAITTWYVDADGDGYGNSGLSLDRCQAPANFVNRGGDCNDADPTTFPGRTEVCDARDNNCDGTIDEGVKSTFYRDADGDGFGDPRNAATTCQIPASGFVAVMGDCDDSRADANPQAMETCNNRDDDCDGVVDGLNRACNNMCGDGTEVCTRGIWAGCTAPPIITVTTTTTLTGSRATYDCLVIGLNGKVVVPTDMTLEARNWLRLESNGVLELGPRSVVATGGELVFAERSTLLASDATLRSATSIQVTQDAKWYAQSPQALAYSTGGAAACAPPTEQMVGGAGGGARGGAGGRGTSCNALVSQPRASSGGMQALTGANGCGCGCTDMVMGAAPAGGWGGGPMAGGGGGANGGTGGNGGRGSFTTGFADGGLGGAPELTLGDVPQFGGGAGGSSGTLVVTYAPEACQGAGGTGGGIVRIFTPRLVNNGLISADGTPGETAAGLYALAGGGGGGAGGTWVFHASSFENRGSISAIGGRGGAGVSRLQTTFAGGGGSGSGGRFFLEALDGGSPHVVNLGNVFVGGGLGGAGAPAGASNGDVGAAGGTSAYP